MERRTLHIFSALIFSVLVLPGGWLGAQNPNPFVPGHPAAPVRDYFQPVRIQGPEGTKIAFSIDCKFVERRQVPLAVGLLLNGDYRLRVTEIPLHPGKEVFPTIKLLGRTYPPRGQELEFPIQINITQEDLELALVGKFVTRVVYLENPETATPIPSDLQSQISMDVAAGADPLAVAQAMGQPIAIVRLGGRLPGNCPDPSFYHGCPPWLTFDKTPAGNVEITRFQNTPRWIPAPQPVLVGIQPGTVIR